MAIKPPKRLQQHMADLAKLEGKTVEAGWFESNRYDDGMSVARIARLNEFGGEVRIPEHDVKVNRSIDKDGEFKHGGKFQKESKANFQTTHRVAEQTVTIPARPFMRLASAKFIAKRAAKQKIIAGKMAKGEISAEQGLAQIGDVMVDCITDSIKNGGWQPNAASTVAKKGFDKPLIDSSEMFKSVSSKVT